VDDVASERSPRGADLERSELDKTARDQQLAALQDLWESLLTTGSARQIYLWIASSDYIFGLYLVAAPA